MEEDGKDDPIDFNTIKVFSSEDEKLKLLGELLSNKSSRDIIKLLVYEEMYTNEIANRLDMRVSLVIHHLKKLKALGLLQVTDKKIVRKGNDHKHFKIIPNIFVTLNKIEENKEKRLKKIFKNTIKFRVLIASFAFASIYHEFFSIKTSETNTLAIPLTILLIGFIIHTIIYSLPGKRKERQ